MKAKVKATGEIVEIQGTIDSCTYITNDYRTYQDNELDFSVSDLEPVSNPLISKYHLESVLSKYEGHILNENLKQQIIHDVS